MPRLPNITQQPASQTAQPGASVTFSVAATSPDGSALTYQWWGARELGVRGNPLAGGNAASLTIPADGTFTQFWCVVTCAGGSIPSKNATLTISTSTGGTGGGTTGPTPPEITQQPNSVQTSLGTSAQFSVGATTATGQLTYQWFLNSKAIPGATGASYTVTSASNALAGNYYCVAGNGTGSTAQSQTVTLTVITEIGGSGPGVGGGSTIGSGGSAGGTATAASFALLANGLGVNGRDFFLDANYSVAQPTGLAVPSYPYLDQDDTTTVVFRQPYEQAIVSYAPLSMKQAQATLAGLYYFGDANFKDGQAGVYVFDRLFGNIPQRRIRRGQSHTYVYQFLLEKGASTSGSDSDDYSYTGPDYSIGTAPFPIDSILQYDYFLDGDDASYPLLRAPSLVQVGQIIEPRGQDFNNPATFPLTVGANGLLVAAANVSQILAEDDRYEDYRGAIKCRVRRLIAAPTQASFTNANPS